MDDERGRPLTVRRRRQPGRPLLVGSTATVVSVMAGCSGNLMPPPSQEVCFHLEPPTATVETVGYGNYIERVYLDEEGCGRVYGPGYMDVVRVSHSGYCPVETDLAALLATDGVVTLAPLPCAAPDMGVRDMGAPQEQGVSDGGPSDGGPDAASDPDAGPADGG